MESTSRHMYWGLREKGQNGTLKPPRPVYHTTIYPTSPAPNPELPDDSYPQELLRIPSALRGKACPET